MKTCNYVNKAVATQTCGLFCRLSYCYDVYHIDLVAESTPVREIDVLHFVKWYLRYINIGNIR